MRIFVLAPALALALCAAGESAADSIGKAMAVAGSASVSGQSGARTLAAGGPVFAGDTVTTGPDGEVQLLFTSGARIVVGTSSEFTINAVGSLDASSRRGTIRAIGEGIGIRVADGKVGTTASAIDVTTRPPERTRMILLKGGGYFCPDGVEDGEGEGCVTITTPCAMLRSDDDEGVKEVAEEIERLDEIRENFPYVRSDRGLLEEFRVAGHGCAVAAAIGGVAASPLPGAVIPPAAAIVGVGALIGVGACLATGCVGKNGEPAAISITNGTN